MIIVFTILAFASSAHAFDMRSEISRLLAPFMNCANGSSSNVDSGTLYIDCTNNRIGIGTAAPAYTLHIGGATGSIGVVGEISKTTSDGADNAVMQIGGGGAAGTTRGAYINLYGNEGTSPGVLQYFGGNVSGFHQWFTDQGGGSVEKMRLTATGSVGIGTANPATLVHMSSGTYTCDGNVQLCANFGGTVRIWSRTKAQIDALTPGAVGEQVFCSDCNTPDICVSTGTAAAQFRRVGTTSGCGSGN